MGRSSSSVAEFIMENIIYRFLAPKHILHDQGREFCNVLNVPLQGCASQAVVQFAPILIIYVFLNQVTSVVLISLYFIPFMSIFIVIRLFSISFATSISFSTKQLAMMRLRT